MTILRFEDGKIGNLLYNNIYGLNILCCNGVSVDIDARLVFLSQIYSSNCTDAHVDILALQGEDPTSYFTEHYHSCNIGFVSDFYWYSLGSRGLIFHDINSESWDSYISRGDSILSYDALALYVASSESAYNALIDIVSDTRRLEYMRTKGSFHTEWLMQVTEIYPLVICNGHDGMYFKIYTQSPNNYTYIAEALRMSTRQIEKSQWYQDNAGKLKWNDDELCLMPSR